MDSNLEGPLKELGKALHEAIERSPDVEDALARLRAHGFHAFLMLEVTVALGKPDEEPSEETSLELAESARRTDSAEMEAAAESDANFDAAPGRRQRPVRRGAEWVVEITDAAGVPLGEDDPMPGMAASDIEYLRSLRIRLD